MEVNQRMRTASQNTDRDSRDISCEMSKIDKPHDKNDDLDDEKHAERKGNGDRHEIIKIGMKRKTDQKKTTSCLC